MKTIKLPIKFETVEDQNIFNDILRQYNDVYRLAYNQIIQNKSVPEVENIFRTTDFKNIEDMDSWFTRCAILKANALFKAIPELNKTIEKANEKIIKHNEKIEKTISDPRLRKKKMKRVRSLVDPEKIVFGGKQAFYDRINGKISNEEFRKNKHGMIGIQGELSYGGNRKFTLNLSAEENSLIFKINRKKHIRILLPQNIRNTFLVPLMFIQENKLKFFVQINSESICISIDEDFNKLKKEFVKIDNRILGIDLNPNHIGISVQDVKDNETSEVIEATNYDLSELTKSLGLKSDDPKQIHKNNKRNFEILQIAHEIIRKAIHYRVSKISMEDLDFSSEVRNKGKVFNKMTSNDWNKSLIINKIKMLCKVYGIEFVQVNACFTSVIGNLQYQFFDPVSASIEIGRRGSVYRINSRGKCHPEKDCKLFPELRVKDQWKEYLTKDVDSWKLLNEKTRNLRYRVSLSESLEFSRVIYKKSCVSLYNFI